MANETETHPVNVLPNLKFNLEQIKTLDEGDVISFKRTLYHHHALLTGSNIKGDTIIFFN